MGPCRAVVRVKQQRLKKRSFLSPVSSPPPPIQGTARVVGSGPSGQGGVSEALWGASVGEVARWVSHQKIEGGKHGWEGGGQEGTGSHPPGHQVPPQPGTWVRSVSRDKPLPVLRPLPIPFLPPLLSPPILSPPLSSPSLPFPSRPGHLASHPSRCSSCISSTRKPP